MKTYLNNFPKMGELPHETHTVIVYYKNNKSELMLPYEYYIMQNKDNILFVQAFEEGEVIY